MMDRFDDLDDAIYRTVHDFKTVRGSKTIKGAVALAPLINMPAGTLNNKAKPGYETHQLGIKETIPIQLTTDNFIIAEAYCRALDGVFMRFGDLSGTSDVELLTTWAALMAEEGETAEAIKKSLEDGKVTRAELRVIRRETFEDITVKLELLQRLEAICDE